MLTLVAVLLIAIELALSLAGFARIVDEDPYVGFSSWAPLFVEDVSDGSGAMLVTAPNKRNLFNEQRFPREKAANTVRVFCLGGSTTYGRPFDDRTAFSAWLRILLREVDPEREWEVINAGGISYASYRIVRLMEELAAYEPDLFIIYTGHNEFLEERTYRDILTAPESIRELGGAVSRTRVYAAAREIRRWLWKKGDVEERTIFPGEVDAILDESIGPEAYHRDDTLQANVLEQFRFYLGRMVHIAHSAGAEVMFIIPTSNIRDFSPFKSVVQQELSDEERDAFAAILTRGEEALSRRDYNGAVKGLHDCLALDPRHAQTWFLLAQAYWGRNEFERAGDAFRRARDEDICPLRALTPMAEIVRTTARRLDVPHADFEAHVRAHAPNGVPGNEQFLDHVHPTVEAHGEIAKLVMARMMDEGWLQRRDALDDARMAEARAEIESAVDDRMRATSFRNLSKVLGWAGKFDEAYTLARNAVALVPDDPESSYIAAVAAEFAGHRDEASERLKKTLEMEPEHPGALLRLGNAYSEQGQRDEAVRCFRALADSEAPTAFLGHNNLANELAAQGNYEEAIEHYEAALTARPNYAEARGNLALALANTGRVDDALHHYERALETDADSAVIHYNVGTLLLREKSALDALSHLETATRLMPNYPPAHYHLALAYEQTGNSSEALVHLERALRLEPRYADALRAKERIVQTK